jgi:hypothetical protein
MDLDKKRRERNISLVQRMKRGEDLMNSAKEDTYFPPRPMIKKDLEVMNKLYKKTTPIFKIIK